jgi:serine-type D-Ala-D-Ala endopeptidase (penicillin-binding protein 7)
MMRWLAVSAAVVLSIAFEAAAQSPVDQNVAGNPGEPSANSPDAQAAPLAVAPAPANAAPLLTVDPPLEPVFVSNIPAVAQLLPDPVQLGEDATPPAAGKASRRKLAIVRDEATLALLQKLKLNSTAALVLDQEGGHLLYAKNGDEVRPIASITKLMTAMVVLDSGLPLDEKITILHGDGALTTRKTRLRPGVTLSRGEMLRLALMASENPAAAALARTYPGGTEVFVATMNAKARELGLLNTHFLDPVGLNPGNVSTPYDLALMVDAGYEYATIREFTTSGSHNLALPGKRRSTFASFYNSNRLVHSDSWQIGLSKTGYISEAGRCLVMQATIAAKPVIIVLLDSAGKISRVSDANRIRHWLEGTEDEMPAPRLHRKRRM